MKLLLDQLGNNSALAFVYSHGKGDSPRITTHLLDPGIVSGPVFEQSAGALLMSGTLTPPEMYAELLALPKSRVLTKEEYPSPFLSDKRPVAIGAGVTTKYDKRGDDNTNKIRSSIGIAANVFTVVGPLSFTLAQDLTKSNSDETESFNFRIGTSF